MVSLLSSTGFIGRRAGPSGLRQPEMTAPPRARRKRQAAQPVAHMDTGGQIRTAVRLIAIAVTRPDHADEPALPQGRRLPLAEVEPLGPDQKIVKGRLPPGDGTASPRRAVSRIEVLLVQAAAAHVVMAHVAGQRQDIGHGSPWAATRPGAGTTTLRRLDGVRPGRRIVKAQQGFSLCDDVMGKAPSS